MRSKVYETVERPSVCLSVCPIIRPPYAAKAGLLLWARQPGDVDRLLHGRRSAANASGVTLTADVGSWTQTCDLSVPVRSCQNNNVFVYASVRLVDGIGGTMFSRCPSVCSCRAGLGRGNVRPVCRQLLVVYHTVLAFLTNAFTVYSSSRDLSVSFIVVIIIIIII